MNVLPPPVTRGASVWFTCPGCGRHTKALYGFGQSVCVVCVETKAKENHGA